MMMMTALLASLLSISPSATAAATAAEPDIGYADSLFDFVDSFDRAIVENTLDTHAADRVASGNVSMAGVFQHPLDNDDARLTYRVELPRLGADARALLLFSLGLRDGVRFDEPGIEVDGVVSGIEIDGVRLFEAVVNETRWREFALDLTAFAGRTIEIVFTTNANGTSNYDWLLWGNPRIYRVWPVSGKARPPRVSTGLLVVRSTEGRFIARRFALDRPTETQDALAELTERLDVQPAEVRLFAFAPRVVLRSLSSASEVLFIGKDYEVRATVENVGEAPVEDFHHVQLGISGAALRRGRADRTLNTLGVGETATLSWQMRGMPRRDSVDVTVSLRAGTGSAVADDTRTATLRFHRPMPPLPARTSKEVRSVVQKDYALLENEYLRIAFIQDQEAYRYFVLFAQKGGHLQQVATTMPISKTVFLDNAGSEQTLPLIPTEVTMGGSSDGDASLFLTSRQEDGDGVEWRFDATFTLYEGSRWVIADYRLATSAPRSLLHFSGPVLRVGDGGAGARKEFALFPGLEMLEKDEVSSSTRDAAPPLNNRFVPHPYKVTIPAMAVEQNGITTGLLWDALAPWDDKEDVGLSAMFASPNWFEGQDNHLLGVFLPTVPDWVPENGLVARKPYPLDENGIELRARILTSPQGSIFDLPDLWSEAYGFPKPADSPRSDEEELVLSRDGFMKATWDEETKKSRHAVGWSPQNAPGFATLLWYDYLATGDEAVRRRVETIARQTIEEQGPEGLASPANTHIMRWEFPFYYGYLEAGLAGAHRQVQQVMSTQKEDGSWRFQPTSERTRQLGNPGDAVLGTSARNALTILKYARVTGDEEALQSGLRALEFMNRFAIPRGAQAWECPLYEPDLLAAAYAVGAYLEAFTITGEQAYLDRAQYWAKTGLPFLYFWNVPGRPGMRFGSIPVFGTTFYTHSWFGVPVQWNGLVYAYYVRRLSRDLEYPWQTIAEGITTSAMYQQWTEGELRGTYPDGFYEFSTEGRGPHINPEDIMVNLLALRGHDPDISTVVVRPTDQARIHISSGAHVEQVEIEGARLRFILNGFPGHDSHVLIGNIPPIADVSVGDEAVPRVESVEDAEQGWRYDPDAGRAILKIPQRTQEVRVTVRLEADNDGDS